MSRNIHQHRALSLCVNTNFEIRASDVELLLCCIVVVGHEKSKRGPITQARAPRANLEVHLTNRNMKRNPRRMRQCQCPTTLPFETLAKFL